jgi:hypothetical protein
VAAMQAEVSIMQTELKNRRFGGANALQTTHQEQHQMLQQPNFNMQPEYSNNSSTSTNNFMNNFNPGFDLTMETAPSSHSLEPFQNSRMSRYEEDDNSTSIQQYYFTVIINEFPFLFLLLHLLSRQHYS